MPAGLILGEHLEPLTINLTLGFASTVSVRSLDTNGDPQDWVGSVVLEFALATVPDVTASVSTSVATFTIPVESVALLHAADELGVRMLNAGVPVAGGRCDFLPDSGWNGRPSRLQSLEVVIVGGGGGSGVSDHGALSGLADDDHTQYALADGSRGSFAPPLGADDNYVTDAEKAVLANTSGTNTGDQDLSGYALTSSLATVATSGEAADLDATGATDGHVLTADGAGGAAWEAPSGGGGDGSAFPVQALALAANYTLDPFALDWPTDQIVTLVLTQDGTGGWSVTYDSADIVMASGVAWFIGTAAGAESVTTWRYSPGLAKWVCEGCWISIAGGVPTDVTPPTVGTMAASSITNTGFTLTVSGASDAGSGLHATPYAFTIDGGTTWSAYQSSAAYVASGLDPDTAYAVNWRVRDASGNIATGTEDTVTTTNTADVTAPTWTATFTLGTPSTTAVEVTASAQATDDVGVAGYEVSYNGGSTWAPITMGGGWTFVLTGDPGTTYSTTKLRAVDAASNASTPLDVPSYTMATSSAVIASDTFTRADGDLGGSTTEVGGLTWVVPSGAGSPKISGNAVGRHTTGAPLRQAYIDVGETDVLVTVTCAATPPQYSILSVRCETDDLDGYQLRLDNGRVYTAGTARTPSTTVTSGDVLAVKVQNEGGGTRCTTYKNGVELGQWLDTAFTFTSTNVGIYCASSPAAVYPFGDIEVSNA